MPIRFPSPSHSSGKHNNDMSYLQWYVFIIHRLRSKEFIFSSCTNTHIHTYIHIDYVLETFSHSFLIHSLEHEREALMWNSICLTMQCLYWKGRKETSVAVMENEEGGGDSKAWGIDWDDECALNTIYSSSLVFGEWESNLLNFNRHFHDSFGIFEAIFFGKVNQRTKKKNSSPFNSLVFDEGRKIEVFFLKKTCFIN